MQYYSQFGQDKFLDEKIFKKKQNGFFIEIGSNNGVTNNNSYFFEKNRKWDGICIEPRGKAFENLIKNRRGICENCCISNVGNKVNSRFLVVDGRGGQLCGLLEKFEKKQLEEIKKNIGEDEISKNIIDVECCNLSSIIKKYNIKHVDYCSIGTQVGELDIVESIDFEKITIDIISIENSYNNKTLKTLLKLKGYRKIYSFSISDIYANKNTVNFWYIYTIAIYKNIIIDLLKKTKINVARKVKKNVSEKTWFFIKKCFLKKAYSDDEIKYIDIKKLIFEIGIREPILIDGGAHKGETISLFKAHFPGSGIYAFEAIPALADGLKILNDVDVIIFNNAIGERDEKIDFRINSSTATSSILDTGLSREYHPGLVELAEKITVDCVSLDSLLKNKEIKQPDIIKLDLQGYELFALKGAKQTIINVKVILTEVEFIPLYKNQPLFEDVSVFMRDNNFRLFNLYDIQVDKSGQITFADAIYVNNNYFKQ